MGYDAASATLPPSLRELVVAVPEEPDRYWPHRICETCAAYTHVYIDACVGCGAQVGTFSGWARLAAVQTQGDVVRKRLADQVSTARFSDWLNNNRTEPDARREEAIIDDAISTFILIGREEGFEPDDYVAEQRDKWMRSTNRTKEQRSIPYFDQLPLRYLGGIPAYPSSADVDVVATRDGISLRARSTTMISLRYEQMIGAWAFPEDVPISTFRIGFVSGPVAFFPGASTFRGGGIAFAAAQDGNPIAFALGNRTGLFARKGYLEYFIGLVQSVGGLIGDSARLREAEVGPWQYADELGLQCPVPGPTPVTTEERPETSEPTLPNGITMLLADLEQARTAGLLTEEEYSAKRSEILARF
jgi:hypothetical protein